MQAIAILILGMLLVLPSLGQRHRSHSKATQTHTSKKSNASGSNDGHYEGGSGGSSHKGGHYKNSTTRNHY